MHVNMGLMPPLTPPARGKRERYAAYAARAAAAMSGWLESRPDLDVERVRALLASEATQ